MSTIQFKRRTDDTKTDPVSLRKGEPFYNVINHQLFVGNSDNDDVAGKKHISEITTLESDNNVIAFQIGEDPENIYEKTVTLNKASVSQFGVIKLANSNPISSEEENVWPVQLDEEGVAYVKGIIDIDIPGTIARAEYAETAGSATKATRDGAGNVITSTYVKKAGDTITGALVVGGNINSGGTISATSFIATSDARLKENIEPYKINNTILDLPVYKFDFINGGTKNNIGCLAQDLRKICPEIVHENVDGYLQIEETKIVYLLLEEVKKLNKEVSNLKQTVDKL